MFHYSPDQEPPSERILLLQASRSQHSNEYGSVTAKVVRRAMKDQAVVNRYFDGTNAVGYRSASWSNNTKSALYVEDLQVHAQFDIGDRTISGQEESGRGSAPPYGEKLVFRDIHQVDAREAELMHTTFKKLQKKLNEQEQSYGYVKDVSDLILRVANALGIRTFAAFKEGYTSLDSPMYEFNAANVGDRITELVKAARYQYP